MSNKQKLPYSKLSDSIVVVIKSLSLPNAQVQKALTDIQRVLDSHYEDYRLINRDRFLNVSHIVLLYVQWCAKRRNFHVSNMTMEDKSWGWFKSSLHIDLDITERKLRLAKLIDERERQESKGLSQGKYIALGNPEEAYNSLMENDLRFRRRHLGD
jgi:hypothetical protein